MMGRRVYFRQWSGKLSLRVLFEQIPEAIWESLRVWRPLRDCVARAWVRKLGFLSINSHISLVEGLQCQRSCSGRKIQEATS